MFGTVREWRGRSGLDQVDLYTRVTVYTLIWVAVPIVIALSVTRPVRHSDAPWPLIAAVVLLTLVQGIWATRLLGAGFDEYLGKAAVPRREVGAGAALMVALLAGLLGLGAFAGPGEYPMLATALGCAVMPFLSAYGLLVPARTTLLVQSAVTLGVCGAVWLIGGDVPMLVATLFAVTFAGAWMAITVRASAWVLAVMYELREARDAQARLAVAEERLRFGRDLHDVMGRNLAVIALKSELAVQLARRGRPEAVDQMTEVQRIAQESQREVREVVRGYRETGLGAELAGAQGVLTAAGIECRVTGAEAAEGLPPAVHSALGWVVREAATNVLRHGDPRRCEITLTVSADGARLVVENDGAPEQTGRAGSGLPGLRERLAVLQGTLGAGPTGDATFQLVAEIPLAPRTAPPAFEERGPGQRPAATPRKA
ncbi:sensor histidine kinase [Streptomyces sp. T-3]|nr:sensor histidine kinase [Streptomyces sp. T-3]